MRVIGFTYKKISIERKKNTSEKINIDTDIQVNNIEKKKNDLFKDQDALNIDYEFKIKYGPDFADLIFEGSILLLMDETKEEKELTKKILDDWKSKKLYPDLRMPVLNIVFEKCNLKAMQLEEYLNLPPHLPTPRFSQGTEAKGKK